jgi:hypothetical protein
MDPWGLIGRVDFKKPLKPLLLLPLPLVFIRRARPTRVHQGPELTPYGSITAP